MDRLAHGANASILRLAISFNSDMKMPIDPQTRVAREAVEHARRQADATEDAVKEARQAIRVAYISLIVSALTVVATIISPFLAQWNADKSNKKAQRETVAAEVHDLQNTIELISQLGRLTPAPIDSALFDADAQGELFKGTAQFEYLHPLEIARAEIAKAVLSYNNDIEEINSQDPVSMRVNEGMGPWGTGIRTPFVPIQRRKSVALWMTQQFLINDIAMQVKSINAESLKWQLPGKECISTDGYPFRSAAKIIMVECNQPTKPTLDNKEKPVMLVYTRVDLKGNTRVLILAEKPGDAHLR